METEHLIQDVDWLKNLASVTQSDHRRNGLKEIADRMVKLVEQRDELRTALQSLTNMVLDGGDVTEDPDAPEELVEAVQLLERLKGA